VCVPLRGSGTFYDRLSQRGFVIYPGKLTVADSFRIGCIGRLGEAEMRGVLDAIRDILAEMGVTRCAPAAAEPAGSRFGTRTVDSPRLP
jgi:aspartate aminotransferase-like enzyme